MIWNRSLTSKGFQFALDFRSWPRTVARVWPNCCQLTLWLSYKQRMAAVVELFKTRLPVKKSYWPQDLSLDDELNHPNLICR